MNSGASWNDGGLSPELYQAAREAARRAGMSVEEWLRSTFGNSAVASVRPAEFRRARRAPRRALATIWSRRGGRARTVVGARRAALRHRRQAQRTPRTDDHEPPGAPASQAAATASRARAGRNPHELGIDQVIAEIAARQRALDAAPEQTRARCAAAAAAAHGRHPRRCLPPISRGSSGSFSTSPSRSRRCGGRPASRTRSPRCAPTSPTSRAPSTTRCRAARSKTCRATCTRSPSGSITAMAAAPIRRSSRRSSAALPRCTRGSTP